MKSQNNHTSTNFWFGFTLGISAAAGALYLLGTKKGRETAHKILEYSENLPEHLPKLIEELNLKHGSSAQNKVKEGLHTLDNIITKIKETSQHK